MAVAINGGSLVDYRAIQLKGGLPHGLRGGPGDADPSVDLLVPQDLREMLEAACHARQGRNLPDVQARAVGDLDGERTRRLGTARVRRTGCSAASDILTRRAAAFAALRRGIRRVDALGRVDAPRS